MKKKLMFGLIALLVVSLVSAGVINHYGKINQEVKVNQAVTLSGGSNCINNECTETGGTGYSGDTLYSEVYTMTNNAGTFSGCTADRPVSWC